ncbi:hypothetical protein EV363DRAFT_1455350 [Boletus edulis]|uniref:Uncharacterized protein n=1 Tax=Boletus edulis BED1 TaxID=1328754 RepID=A0AAD4BGP8_BOLED|nr:hypothetical protein EV363DRAFT_1455350 [Boletus edulis]KAF8429975.1 hypothetical protein L210DRAFT_3651947 [Boletus edulis BED1]
MTLGSIRAPPPRALFQKTGIAAKSTYVLSSFRNAPLRSLNNPSKKLNSWLISASGLPNLKTSKSSLSSIMDFELPPPPVDTPPSISSPCQDPRGRSGGAPFFLLLLVVAQDLTAVTHTWSEQLIPAQSLILIHNPEEHSRVPFSDEAYDAQNKHASSQDQHPHLRGVITSGLVGSYLFERTSVTASAKKNQKNENIGMTDLSLMAGGSTSKMWFNDTRTSLTTC